MRPSPARQAIVALFLLASIAVLLQGGSVPHAHQERDPAFFNAEHDLTLLAGLATQGIAPDALPVVVPGSASAPLPDLAPQHPPVRLAQAGDSRAPPLA
jgi:hypothetical protein